MVIGSATELRKLGEQLQEFASQQPGEFSEKAFPPAIVFMPINSPDDDFALSFHLDTKSQNRPVSNFPSKVWGRWGVLLLATVGLVSLLRWILSEVLR